MRRRTSPIAWRRSAGRPIRTSRSSSSTTGAPTGRARSPGSSRPRIPASACSRSTICRPAGPARPTRCIAAAELARGEWLWFLDADTLHAPESLAILMEYGRTARRGAGQPAARAAVRDLLGAGRAAAGRDRPDAVVPAARASIDDRSPLAFANGQYILIRRTAYDAAGGHEAVRDRFVEDIALAGRVKARASASASP